MLSYDKASKYATITSGEENRSHTVTSWRMQTNYDPEIEEDPPIADERANQPWPKALPPKQIYGYRHETAYFRLIRLLMVLGLVITTVYSLAVLIPFESNRPSYNSCESSSASWFESRFFINVVVIQGLSFTQAKLMDLAWDTFIGQGLRFVHAWWLYQVATHVITCVLEASSLPYGFQLNILFSPASFLSLWEALKMSFKRRPTIGRIYFAWLVFAIGYILAFPTLWAASTGYSTPSITAYNFSNKAYVPSDSYDLTLCWSINDSRLDGLVDSVVLGGSFAQLYDKAQHSVPTSKDEWSQLHVSSNFLDIFSYAKKKRSLQNYFDASDDSWSNMMMHRSSVPGTAEWDDENVFVSPHWNGYSFHNESDRTQLWPSPGFVRVLNTSQYFEFDLYYLNESLSLRPGIVPYNSTFNRTKLSAPFVNFGVRTNGDYDCFWWNSTTGECPCFLGKPVADSWAIDDQFTCISAQGYVWGFSSSILMLSIILETVWVVGCWYTRLHTTINSKLIEYNRLSTGTVRHILDLAEAMNRDLGPDTSIYTDKELKEALKHCPPVGYRLETKDGIKHVGLVTVHHEGNKDRRKAKMDINFDDIYG